MKKIGKTGMSALEAASRYFEVMESVLRAMISSTMNGNFPAVFVLNRPLFHACYKGMWISLVENQNEVPDDLLALGRGIDAVVAQRFKLWNAPFITGNVARYGDLLASPIHGKLSDSGSIKPSKLIERLHDDVHSGLPSLEFYQQLIKNVQLVHSAKELCVIGHSPLYLNLRFAISKRFPEGPVASRELLFDPFAHEILALLKYPE